MELRGRPFKEKNVHGWSTPLGNIFFSRCASCNDIAIWLRERLVYPAPRSSLAPNLDMPPDLIADFEEAAAIVDRSPRGAAALLRLIIQKLCQHLGEAGKNIDDDIASLVKKGLHPVLQKSMDIVRVIGNEAVHPGTIDLRDDRVTALTLFKIVNNITETAISHPKMISEMYDGLPPNKLKGISSRDAK